MSLPDTLIISPSVLYFGTPVALVGTADRQGHANARFLTLGFGTDHYAGAEYNRMRARQSS